MKRLPDEVRKIRREQLGCVRDKLAARTISETLSFSDKHGRPDDLQRIVERARQAARAGSRLRIVCHGDSFDRGSDNVAVFRLLQELEQIAKDHPTVDAEWLWGNHDVMLVDALLLGGEGKMGLWLDQGGAVVSKQFEEAGVDLKELGFFMLQNFRLFHVDDLDFMHIHALCPVDVEGDPSISRSELERLQERWISIQDECNRTRSVIESPVAVDEVRRILREAELFLWTRTRDWHMEFQEDLPLLIDDANKRKLLDVLRTIFRERIVRGRTERKGSPLSAAELRDVTDLVDHMVDRSWQEMLLDYRDRIRDAGVEFELLDRERIADKNKVDRFLAGLGVAGYVAGHDHHRRLVNIDDRVFGIDVDDEDPGHLVLGNDGIRFDAMAREEVDVILDREQWLTHLDAQVERLA